jgi:hypothetical protein
MPDVNVQQGEHWWDLTVTIVPEGSGEITYSKPDPWAEVEREAGG